VNEIVVVDTGSRDETMDIARVFGARVYHFPWTDDFSEARNHALSKAAGDWILVLDADEVLSRKDDGEFRQALAMRPKRPAAYRIQTRNYTFMVNAVGFNSNRGEYAEERGLGWYPSDKVRLFTNDARIRFDYPVHELVEPSLQRLGISVMDCPMVVHHYGTLEERHTLEKTKKYQVLARKKLKRGLNNKAALRELAVQASQVGNHSEALRLWGRFIKLQPGSVEAYINMGSACCNLGRLDDAMAFAQKALHLNPALKEAKFNKSIALLLMGRAGEAKTLLEGLSKEQPGYLPPRFLLCVAYACLQEAAPAENIIEGLKTLPMGEHIGEAFLDVARRFLSVSRRDYALRTLEAALHFGCGSMEIRAVCEGCGGGA
jgi:glycosyltransferase involved in cell wall biosynthesis